MSGTRSCHATSLVAVQYCFEVFIFTTFGTMYSMYVAIHPDSIPLLSTTHPRRGVCESHRFLSSSTVPSSRNNNFVRESWPPPEKSLHSSRFEYWPHVLIFVERSWCVVDCSLQGVRPTFSDERRPCQTVSEHDSFCTFSKASVAASQNSCRFLLIHRHSTSSC